MKWNNGDFIVIVNNEGEKIGIAILDYICNGRIHTWADIPVLSEEGSSKEDEEYLKDWIPNEPNVYYGCDCRAASEEEKERLINALAEEGVRWDDEKKEMVALKGE